MSAVHRRRQGGAIGASSPSRQSMRLDRASERRGEFGGITADGMINVLGRPRLDSLALVLREAAQNSWDARLRTSARDRQSPPAFRVRIRTLSVEHERAFREAFHDP